MTDEADHTAESWPANIVIRVRGPFYDVLTPQGVVRCVVRGALKKERRREDLVVVGDRVAVRIVAPGEGVIEEVAPRRRALVRRARDREAAQVIVANLDQLVVVMAAAQPELSLGMLDRFLVVAESQELPTVICLNKVDLDPAGRARAALAPYRTNGYPVVETSVVTGEGLADLWRTLEGKLSALAGPSGVGKTSLVKAFRPELQLRIGAVSEATGRGRHTTTASELIRLDERTFLVDTPGIGVLHVWGILPEELGACFREFRPYLAACAYRDCRHVDEPGCAVRAAVDAGEIDAGRYERYLAIYRELEEEVERQGRWEVERLRRGRGTR
ncbi:MAG: ribosome small subunit-dependent GTPase A [Thermomicrobium sp.]|nr:ribosome small subunit-dependent GTPase A [Thermomicrobium sp.]MDW8060164.1 ribosome small subunit-dependent GTPase A [Thermomicrobium sp.]